MNKKSFAKRILTVALSIIMVLGVLPMTALASDVFPGKPDGMTISGSSTETINGQTVWLCPNSGGSIVKKNTGNGYVIYEAAPYGGYTFSHWATYCVAADWSDTFESTNRYDEEEGYAFSKSDSKTARYNEKDDQIRVNTSSEANYTYYVYAVFVQGVSVSISVEGGGADIYAKNLDNYISSAGEYEYYVQAAEGTVHFGADKNSQMEVQILTDWATYFEHVYVNDVDVINTSNVYYFELGSDRMHFYVQKFTVTEPITIRAVTKQRGVNVTFYSNDVNAIGTMEKRFLQCYEDYNIPENQFINEGYIFSGWNTKSDGTGIAYTDKQSVRFTIADDGTELGLYAQWIKCNNHTWTDGKCTDCSTTCSHSGGNATCTEKAVCSICALPYGEIAGHNWGDWISNGNATHTRTCANDTNHTETNDCSGGAATCTEKAKCSVCATAYGDLAEHTYGTEWKFDGTNHWHECSCGAKSEEAAHSGGNATCADKAVCSICAQPYGEIAEHNWGDWISNGNATHTRTCANDTNHTETNDCSGGTATCTEKAKCSVCATAYGDLAEHTHGTEWKFDGTNHWHECSCGAKTEKAAHSGGTATCTDKAVCSVCGITYNELSAHNYKDGKCTVCEVTDPDYQPPTTGSPQTDDNSYMALWIALLFISGGAVVTLTVYDRKRRTAANK